MGDIFALALVVALALLLVSAGIEDARTREIANWKNAAIAAMAPLWWLASGLTLWPGVAIQIGIALVVFALFTGAFALRMMGGGDVKLIAALALWLPIEPLVWMLILMSLVGGAVTMAMLIEKWLRRSATTPEIPYGVAIAIAALLALREPIINQFG